MGVAGYENGFKLTLHPERLNQPLNRKKPTVYFVNSMSDLFHEDIPDGFIDQVMEAIRLTPRHIYQILTKRAERMARYFEARGEAPVNAWLGVTVEDRKHGIPRADLLRRTPAAIRFLSMEPLLEDPGALDLSGVHWVIVGGESGPKARPMRAGWVENVRAQAEEAGAAFFFKQWGAWGADGRRRSKKANGRLFKGRTWDETPAVAAAA